MKRNMNFNKTERKQSLDVRLHLITFWSQLSLKLGPQLTDFNKHINGFTSVIFINIEVECGEVVAESCSQPMS